MYNRYIPGSNGIYQRHSVEVPDNPAHCVIPGAHKETEEHHKEKQTWSNVQGLDLGDMLLICIVVLMLLDSEDGDILPILVSVAAFLFLQ